MSTLPTRILVTGSAGYIGSHAVIRLLEDGCHVVGLDDFTRGNPGAVEAVSRFAEGCEGSYTFVEGSIGDQPLVESLLRDHKIDLVMHFAALAYVGESVHEPLRYYDTNTGGAISLLRAVDAAGVNRFVFSSTCATYGIASIVYTRFKKSGKTLDRGALLASLQNLMKPSFHSLVIPQAELSIPLCISKLR